MSALWMALQLLSAGVGFGWILVKVWDWQNERGYRKRRTEWRERRRR